MLQALQGAASRVTVGAASRAAGVTGSIRTGLAGGADSVSAAGNQSDLSGGRGFAECVTRGVGAFPATVPEASFTLSSGGKETLAFTGIVKATGRETRAANGASG